MRNHSVDALGATSVSVASMPEETNKQISGLDLTIPSPTNLKQNYATAVSKTVPVSTTNAKAA